MQNFNYFKTVILNKVNNMVSKDLIAPIMGVIVILFLLFITYSVFGRLNLPDNEWTRAVYLLSGIEAVAFAGAGFLFGREVNRQRAENAEGLAAESKAKATVAEDGKKKVEKKLNRIEALVDAKENTRSGAEGTARPNQDWEELAVLVKEPL